MNPQPPTAPSPTRRDDLAAVVRDATLSYPASDMNDDSLLEATRQFIKALEHEHIPHALVGGLAVLQYVDGRNTRDIDLIIAIEDLSRLPDFLLEEQNEWFATGMSGPLRVDLLFTANPLFADVLAHHSEARDFLGTRLNCATPPGIILLKLFALPALYRQGNIDRAALYETDILQLLHHHPADAMTLLHTLKPHLPPSDINALREVLTDIQSRLSHANRF
ncbi:MAG: hypothetical protein NTW21_40070 [Verrucomicrobia bacterium]|nr:hypothetical protein [Verrucomicrobiota bacterium]